MTSLLCPVSPCQSLVTGAPQKLNSEADLMIAAAVSAIGQHINIQMYERNGPHSAMPDASRAVRQTRPSGAGLPRSLAQIGQIMTTVLPDYRHAADVLA